ncbi:MAG TPA: hypothetical protein VM581_04680 [Magnetospirillaceae bacterium]|nr:hypothetical protein [Magnetospirillaceae bacterium]
MNKLGIIFGRIPPRLRPIILGVVAVIVSFLPQFIGLVFIAVYAGVSFALKLPSRTTFWAALVALGCMSAAVAAQQDMPAQNFGAYSFILFVVGVISLCTELIRAAKAMQTHKAVDKQLLSRIHK